jgi:hypothetical protein
LVEGLHMHAKSRLREPLEKMPERNAAPAPPKRSTSIKALIATLL